MAKNLDFFAAVASGNVDVSLQYFELRIVYEELLEGSSINASVWSAFRSSLVSWNLEIKTKNSRAFDAMMRVIVFRDLIFETDAVEMIKEMRRLYPHRFLPYSDDTIVAAAKKAKRKALQHLVRSCNLNSDPEAQERAYAEYNSMKSSEPPTRHDYLDFRDRKASIDGFGIRSETDTNHEIAATSEHLVRINAARKAKYDDAGSNYEIVD